MKKVLAFALIFLLGFGVPAFSFGEKSKRCKGKKGECKAHWETKDMLSHKVFFKGRFYLKNAEALNLTEEQKEKIKSIKISLKKDLLRNNAEIETTKIDLKAALHKKPLDAVKLASIVDKEYELKKKMAKDSVQALVSIKGVLADEQKEIARALYKKHKPKKSKYSKDKGFWPLSW